ncbi:protein of unknown function DUF192 [Gloeothece citriformis PCC 7424]|uniref:DUF192 domain-containing protein n=1 Tax=Gloeothece citriformis (strain PCC 7424) TaxID=65393 RepID=B7KIH1_GLOC7|nr:DUF192 domain-containing protein [Gloeothece citriformis]ACK69377.1 protein of unknown function DUF192 [Gloeothece citriformis PCC 7424]
MIINPKFILILFLGVTLFSCSPTPSINPDSTPLKETQNPFNPSEGQMLPISAKAIMKGETIELEVAKTPQQQALGLMYRTELPKNRGMFFPFSEARYAKFWMKNVAISLDMIFLKDGTIQAIFADVPPCQSDPCPVYGPATLVDGVIELPGGRAAELGLEPGDRITLEFLNTP